MAHTKTTFKTDQASRYLQQLCKHFGHKIPAEYGPTHGRIVFPFGTCELAASEVGLTLHASGAPRALEKLERVLGNHLERFAFREAPALRWQRSPDPTNP